MSNEFAELEDLEESKFSKYDFVKNSYYGFNGKEDKKTIKIICDIFLQNKCTFENFEYLLSIENFRMVGACYLHGRGEIEKDYRKAFEYFEKASLGINPEDVAYALVDVGNCYWFGRGIEKDYNKAFQQFEKAYGMVAQAPEGASFALISIGDCYFEGNGVEQDDKKAYDCFLKSSEMGNVGALIDIGECYFIGRGVEQDYKKAFDYYGKASEMGNMEAFKKIINCYENGKGVEYDYRKALQFRKKAGEFGSIRDLIELGDCYYYGRQIKQDLRKAYETYKKAEEFGDLSGRIAQSFSKDQVEKFETVSVIKDLKSIIEGQARQIQEILEKLKEYDLAILYAPPSVPNGGIGFQKAKEEFESLANLEKSAKRLDENGPLD